METRFAVRFVLCIMPDLNVIEGFYTFINKFIEKNLKIKKKED